MSKWTLREAISVSALDKHLLKFKQPVKNRLEGDVGEYVDILEFIVDWLANRTTAQDGDFEIFMDKLGKSYSSGNAAEKGGDIKSKAARIKKIEKQPKDEPSSKVSVAKDEPSTDKSSTPPQIPSTSKQPKSSDKPKEKPSFGSNTTAPSLSSLAGDEMGKKSSGDDIWDKAIQQSKDLYSKTSEEPKLGKPIEPDPKDSSLAGTSSRFKSGSTQNWKPGELVDVGFVKNLMVKQKKGRFWHLVGKNNQEYVFEPHVGLKKLRKL